MKRSSGVGGSSGLAVVVSLLVFGSIIGISVWRLQDTVNDFGASSLANCGALTPLKPRHERMIVGHCYSLH